MVAGIEGGGGERAHRAHAPHRGHLVPRPQRRAALRLGHRHRHPGQGHGRHPSGRPPAAQQSGALLQRADHHARALPAARPQRRAAMRWARCRSRSWCRRKGEAMGSRYHARVALIYAIETSLVVEGASPEEIEVSYAGAPKWATRKLGVADYPLAEKRPELIEGRRGKRLADITLDARGRRRGGARGSPHHARRAADAGGDRARRRPADAGGEFRARGGAGRRAAGFPHAGLRAAPPRPRQGQGAAARRPRRRCARPTGRSAWRASSKRRRRSTSAAGCSLIDSRMAAVLGFARSAHEGGNHHAPARITEGTVWYWAHARYCAAWPLPPRERIGATRAKRGLITGATSPRKMPPARPGSQQSPLDIVGATEAELPELKLSWLTGGGKIVNNGHTIQLNVPPGSTLTAGGDVYDLVQFHFHAPSEHLVDGKHFPMEVHFVHKKQGNGGLGVVGVFFDAGEPNAAFAAIAGAFPHGPRTGGRGARGRRPERAPAAIPEILEIRGFTDDAALQRGRRLDGAHRSDQGGSSGHRQVHRALPDECSARATCEPPLRPGVGDSGPAGSRRRSPTAQFAVA